MCLPLWIAWCGLVGVVCAYVLMVVGGCLHAVCLLNFVFDGLLVVSLVVCGLVVFVLAWRLPDFAVWFG